MCILNEVREVLPEKYIKMRCNDLICLVTTGTKRIIENSNIMNVKTFTQNGLSYYFVPFAYTENEVRADWLSKENETKKFRKPHRHHKTQRKTTRVELNSCLFIMDKTDSKVSVTVFPFGSKNGATYNVKSMDDDVSTCMELYKELAKSGKLF